MKTRIARVCALMTVACASSASAFSLDFSSLTIGTMVPDAPGSLVINVPGYGNVAFSGGFNTDAEIASMMGSGGPTNVINMMGGENLLVTFQGDTPLAVNFGYEEVDPGEVFTSSTPFGPSQYIVNLGNGNAGVSSVNFTVVPEPAAALLGGMGLLFLFRRRRA